MVRPARGLLVHADDLAAVLGDIARVIASRKLSLRRLESTAVAAGATISFDVDADADVEALAEALRTLPAVRHVQPSPSLEAIYGKRVIIMGGGAQVGQVAVGAISEADRHNIRGERISVDTIPLVGEQALAAAVGAVAQLPRAKVLVLAGAMMGGAITVAVRDLQRQGLIVIALNMAGSVRGMADLVVTDPIQAGVMAVMAIADTAAFDIARQRGKQY